MRDETKEFIRHLHWIVRENATSGDNANLSRAEQLALEEQFDGLMHTILAMLDGVAQVKPAMISKALSDNSVMLHDEYYQLRPDKRYTETNLPCPACGAASVASTAYYGKGVCRSCEWRGPMMLR